MTDAVAFARPEVLFGLALLPLWGLLRWRAERRRTVPYPPLQYRPPRGWRRWAQAVSIPVECLLLAAVVAALAGPYRESEVELIDDPGIDVVLALDVSLSMLATDFPPDRLEALRRLAHDFVIRAGGHRVGIVIFAKDSFVQTPLTTDHQVLRQLLDGVTVHTLDQTKSGGTALGDALLVAAEHLKTRRLPGRGQAVVLITDGQSNAGSEPTLGARYLRELDIRLYAIGIGGEEPVEVFFEGRRVGTDDDPYLTKLDDAELRRIAAAAGGRSYRAVDADALERVFGELSRLESAPLEVRRMAVRRPVEPAASLAAWGLFAVTLVMGGVLLRRPFR
ncbi:MAG: VWA domain-containing protein [Thermoanaerobaculia bacterium]|nr:VWA domain-containing protein [Thermoanaerobaculia bacterium]